MDEILLNEGFAVIGLPSNTVEVDITAKVYHEGEIITVNKLLKMSDVREAFRKAEEGYIDENDRFVLTEKGMELSKSSEDGNGTEINKEN